MSDKTSGKRENVWLSLALNVLVPSLILMKGAKAPGWSPALVLVIALAFPIGYFLYDLRRRGRRNIIAIIGFVNVLATGGVGLLRLDNDWIAIKEAAVPGIYALAVLLSMFTKRPLARALLLNPDFFDVARIEAALDARGSRRDFNRVLRKGTYLLAGSMLLSSVLNYVLARIMVTAESGSERFVEQLGRMQLVSYPVIALPTLAVGVYALMVIMKGLQRDTGLKLEEVLPEAGRKQ